MRCRRGSGGDGDGRQDDACCRRIRGNPADHASRLSVYAQRWQEAPPLKTADPYKISLKLAIVVFEPAYNYLIMKGLLSHGWAAWASRGGGGERWAHRKAPTRGGAVRVGWRPRLSGRTGGRSAASPPTGSASSPTRGRAS